MSYPGNPQIRVGDWNAPLYVCAFVDLRGKNISLDLIRPDSSRLSGRGVALGFGDVNLPDQTMLQGQWIVYMIENGDLTMPGIYTAQINSLPLTPNGQITQAQFVVGE